MGDIDFQHLKVLVVEDNDFVRFMLKKHLSDYGVPEILEATNGEEGVGMLSAAPDLIICDINMEPLNGFDFLKHVRSQETPLRSVPIIFLTSNATADFVQKAVDLTVDAYILKPVGAETLKSKIVALLSKRLPKADAS